MKPLSCLLKRSPDYFILYSVFFTLLLFFCIAFNKSEGFMVMNQFHSRVLDGVFMMFTHLGNGLCAVGLVAFLLIRRKTRWSFQTGISFLVSGIIAQILKHLVHSPRPQLYFGPNTLHSIYGMTCTGYTSFPSGHTTTIFALTSLLSLYFPGRATGLLFFAIAGLTGFSRIYLYQHFPIDVLTGSLIGVLISMAVYIYIPFKYLEKKFSPAGFEVQTIKLQ